MSLNKNFENIDSPNVVVFDWDNTLLDAWNAIHNSMSDTVKKFKNQKWSMPKTKAMISSFKDDYMLNAFGDKAEEAMQYYRSCFKQYKKEDLVLMPGAIEVIKFVWEKNIPMSIASNKHGDLLRSEISKLEMTHFFHKIVGAEDIAYSKPAKEVVEEALLDLQYSGAVWFIGDTVIDMECAHISGCVPILYGKLDEYIINSKYQPKVCFEHYSELLKVLRNY